MDLHEPTTHVVALSGGKDSTALALRLHELTPEIPFVWLCTPTGDELPEMLAHWERLEGLLGSSLTRVTNQTLDAWIDHFGALPNWRQRWCTRLLKIEPCLAWMARHAPPDATPGPPCSRSCGSPSRAGGGCAEKTPITMPVASAGCRRRR